MSLFTKLFGTSSQRELKSIYPIADKVDALEEEYKKLTERLGRAPDATFWKAYRGLLETYPGGSFPGGYDSFEVQRMMMNIASDGDWNDLLAKTIRFLEGRYEEDEADDYEEFYEPVEDDEELPF